MKQVKEYKIEEKNKNISNAVLKKISKNWTKEEWEDYLTENIDVELTETQIEPKEYKRICGNLTESIFKYSSAPKLSNRRLKDKLKLVLNLLSPLERKVIHLLFWKNKTYGEIAENLHLSYGNVYTLKERAFQKLKSAFLKQGKPKVVDINTQRKEGKKMKKKVIIKKFFKKNFL